MKLRQFLILCLLAAFSTGGTFTCKSSDDDDDDNVVVVTSGKAGKKNAK